MWKNWFKNDGNDMFLKYNLKLKFEDFGPFSNLLRLTKGITQLVFRLVQFYKRKVSRKEINYDFVEFFILKCVTVSFS